MKTITNGVYKTLSAEEEAKAVEHLEDIKAKSVQDDAKIREKNEKQIADNASAMAKLGALGLTTDEIASLTKYTPSSADEGIIF
jgi:hypothetical protein|tara:strand:+ start:625 stop:876 length:252 start_codon:yes stop_codon:yes gene_type:complete